MLKIDKCKNCHHFMSFKGLPSLFDADKTGMCIEAGENYKKWVVMAATDTCCNFKDRAGVKIIEKARANMPENSERFGCANCISWMRQGDLADGMCSAYKKMTDEYHNCNNYKPMPSPVDILKSTEVVGKCVDCEDWNAAKGTLATFCAQVQQFVNADACCPKYRECHTRRILNNPPPIEIVKPAICKNCDNLQGDKTKAVAWCNKKGEAVDLTYWCNDYKEFVPVTITPAPTPTPVQPNNEIGPGEKFEAIVGQQMTLLWVGEQLVIGRDDKGKEHGFDKSTMRFRKC